MFRGDYVPGDTIDFKFTTVDPATGLPATLTGATISVYKANDVAQSTTGVTLTADFDGVTGLNNVRIATADPVTFYTPDTDFDVVITVGTVGGLSVVGQVVGRFSLSRTGAQRAFLRRGTSQAGAASTITLDSVASASDDFYNNRWVRIVGGTGLGQQRLISDYVGATKVATVNAAWTVTPDNTSIFEVLTYSPAPADTQFVLGAPAVAVAEVEVGSFTAGALASMGRATGRHQGIGGSNFR